MASLVTITEPCDHTEAGGGNRLSRPCRVGEKLIQFTLHGVATFAPGECPMGRSFNGWHEGMTEASVFDVNRGRWVLGERADHERYVLFNAEGIVRAAGEISRIAASDGKGERDPDGRRVIIGKPLLPGHPVHDAYVGKPSPVAGNRNPVAYFASGLDHRLCGCGCGQPVNGKSAFVAGHDQRAIHERIAKVGTVSDFLDWFDQVWSETGVE